MQLDSQSLEVQTELEKIGVIPENSEIELYSQIHGGADTTIFEIGFKNNPTRYVQRIFRPAVSTEEAEFEYKIQKTLFENGINVPQTFLIKHPPNTQNRTYFLMEKIQGRGMSEVMEHSPEQFEEVVVKYLEALHSIHTIDPNLFPEIPKVEIQKNPTAVIDQSLRRVKSAIEKYPKDLAELSLIVDWLEENKTNNPCNELVVIHGDFHPYNIVLDNNQTLQVLDWTGINISDFRRDLGFATVAISAGGGVNYATQFARKYEQLSGKKVENLGYFMILSSVYNMMRFYSIINNPSITGESEDTMNFFKSINHYPLFLVKLVKEECNIDLKQIQEYFEM